MDTLLDLKKKIEDECEHKNVERLSGFIKCSPTQYLCRGKCKDCGQIVYWMESSNPKTPKN